MGPKLWTNNYFNAHERELWFFFCFQLSGKQKCFTSKSHPKETIAFFFYKNITINEDSAS